jgi:hypothetical protein
MLNALERLAGGFQQECSQLRQDLNIAQSQLRDYQCRLGQPFQQEVYLTELTTLRELLKAKLTAGNPQTEDFTGPTTFDLSEQIRQLRTSQQTAALSPAEGRRQVAFVAEIPVTVRIQTTNEVDDIRGGNRNSATSSLTLMCSMK